MKLVSLSSKLVVTCIPVFVALSLGVANGDAFWNRTKKGRASLLLGTLRESQL
jgi:hypothetical protein